MIENLKDLEKELNARCDDKKTKIKIQKMLRTIPPLKDFPNGKLIPIDDVENAIIFMTKKWEIQMQWIDNNFSKHDTYYSVGIKETINHEWLGNCYGSSIYELYTKVAIKMYYDIKLRKIKKRELK